MKFKNIYSDLNYILLIMIFNLLTKSVIFGQNLDNLNLPDKFLYLMSPRGTETFYYGDEISIQWESAKVSEVNIYFMNNEKKWIEIEKGIDAKLKEFSWLINSDVPQLTKILIIDSNDSNFIDSTQFNIRIKYRLNERSVYKSTENQNTSTITLKRIMPLGDSITEGYPIAERNSYRKKLKELLTNNGLDFDFVGNLTNGTFSDNDHEGHGGYSAKYWYPPLPQPDIYSNITSYLNSHPPDIILFHIGTNDINDFKYSGDLNVANTTASDVSECLDLIYSFNSNIKVILAKIVNRTDDASTTALNESTATTQFNTALTNMATTRSEYGSTLYLVNMDSALSYPGDLSADGLHPNQTGYDKMAPVWLSGIRTILPKLNLKVFLEGPYSGSSSMNTSLSNIPSDQPFNQSPWNFTGTEHTSSMPSGVVDWVLVSLRTGTSESTTVAQRAGFLKSNGSVVDIDGTSPLAFVVDEGYYYVSIEQRNHLPIMSASTVHVVP